MDGNNAAERVIERFGGLSSLAKALGHKHPTTVQGWKERGVIPQRNWPAIIDAAADHGFELVVSDFVDLPAAETAA